MQKQKRGFWLFIFPLIPGAGEMYMGFKNRESVLCSYSGVSLPSEHVPEWTGLCS